MVTVYNYVKDFSNNNYVWKTKIFEFLKYKI